MIDNFIKRVKRDISATIIILIVLAVIHIIKHLLI